MKKTISIIATSAVFILSAFGLPSPNLAALVFAVNFDFASNPDFGNFFVYYGTSGSSNYNFKVNGGSATNFTVGSFQRNTLFWLNMTACSTNGVEGDYTTEQTIRTWNKPKQVAAFNVSQ